MDYGSRVHEDGRASSFHIGALYSGFFIIACIVQQVYEAGFSACITLSGALQTLAFTSLLLSTLRKRSTPVGLSQRALWLYAVMLVCRLTSTLFKNGYLAVDETGDGLYQFCDILSLLVVSVLSYRGFTQDSRKADCDKDASDCFPVQLLIGASAAVAVLIHPSMNHNAPFDIAWTTSLYLETVALVPQLFAISALGGELDPVMGHYVGTLTLSRAVCLLFWIHGYEDLAPRSGATNWGGLAVVVAQLLQLLLSADFMFYYVKALALGKRLVLPTTTVVHV